MSEKCSAGKHLDSGFQVDGTLRGNPLPQCCCRPGTLPHGNGFHQNNAPCHNMKVLRHDLKFKLHAIKHLWVALKALHNIPQNAKDPLVGHRGPAQY